MERIQVGHVGMEAGGNAQGVWWWWCGGGGMVWWRSASSDKRRRGMMAKPVDGEWVGTWPGTPSLAPWVVSPSFLLRPTAASSLLTTKRTPCPAARSFPMRGTRRCKQYICGTPSHPLPPFLTMDAHASRSAEPSAASTTSPGAHWGDGRGVLTEPLHKRRQYAGGRGGEVRALVGGLCKRVGGGEGRFARVWVGCARGGSCNGLRHEQAMRW